MNNLAYVSLAPAPAEVTKLPCPLEACGLTVSYGGLIRLRDVSAAFPQHQVTAVLGPSGCGKSTLLRSLNRTLELTPGARIEAGTVMLDGMDAYRDDVSASWVRTHIGMLQQKPAPFP